MTSTLTPSWALFEALLEWMAFVPSFAVDRDLITRGLDRIRTEGTASDGQRRLLERGGLAFLVESLAEQTSA